MRVADRRRTALDDRPSVALVPAHRQVVVVRPAGEFDRFGGLLHGRRDVDAVGPGRTEIGRLGQQSP